MKEYVCPNCGRTTAEAEPSGALFCGHCNTRLITDPRALEKVPAMLSAPGGEVQKLRTLEQLALRDRSLLNDSESIARNLKACLTSVLIITVFVLLALLYAAYFHPDKLEVAILLLLVIYLVSVALVIGFAFREKPGGPIAQGYIPVPLELEQVKGKRVELVNDLLRRAGFWDVQCIPLRDLVNHASPEMEFTVEAVSVDDRAIRLQSRYAPNAKIVIYYHSNQ